MRSGKARDEREAADAQSVHRPAKPPGPVILASTVLTVAVWLCLHYNLWPSPFGRHTWADPLLAAASAVVTSVVLTTVWAIKTLYVIGRDQRWSWWILSAPAVVGAAAAVVALTPPATFLDVRGEFEVVARELSDRPESSREEIEIGPFDISSARSTSLGAVYFFDNDSMLSTTTGWVYSPGGDPSGFDDFRATHLDGPWYEFHAVWRD